MKHAFLAALLLMAVFGSVHAEDSDWQLRVITLRSGATLRGLVRSDNTSVYLDDGSGALPFEKASVTKIEPVPEADVDALIAEIEKRREYTTKKRNQERAQNETSARERSAVLTAAKAKRPDWKTLDKIDRSSPEKFVPALISTLETASENELLARSEVLKARLEKTDWRAPGYAVMLVERQSTVEAYNNARITRELAAVKIETEIDFADMRLTWENGQLVFSFTLTRDPPALASYSIHFYVGSERKDDWDLKSFSGMKKGETTTLKHTLSFRREFLTRIVIK